MAHLSTLARRAHTFIVRNPNKESVMSRTRMMATLVAASVSFVSLAALTGCGGDPADGPLSPVRLDATALSEVCKATAPPAFCASGLTLNVKHVDASGETVNPETNAAKCALAFADGTASCTISDLGAPGEYVLSLEGLTDGYMVKNNTGGFVVDEVMVMYRGVNNLDMVISVDGTNSSNPGSGKGNLCVGVTDTNGTVDVSTCVFDVDGNAVTPDADTNGDCPDGALLAGLNAKVSVLAVTCGSEEGSLTTEVAEDTVTGVSVTVEEPNTDPGTAGDLCVSVKNEQQAPLSNCSLDFLQLVTDPTASASPPSGCDSAGDYFFTSVEEGVYDLAVTCGGLSGQRKAEVVAGESQHVWMTLMAPVPDGVLCVGKAGLPIDWDTPSADMAQWLGYGSGGSCVTATANELAGMSVLDFSQTSGPGTCTDASDPNCPITVQELVVSVPSWTGYSTPGEQRVFAVTVEDANQNTVVVYIDTVNGYFQP